jgi:hypothetical protein
LEATSRSPILAFASSVEADKLGPWAPNLSGELCKHPETSAQAGELERRWKEKGSKELKAVLAAAEKIGKK